MASAGEIPWYEMLAENCEGAKFRDRCGAEEALSLVELSGAVRGAAH
jgi:hypothetical protein